MGGGFKWKLVIEGAHKLRKAFQMGALHISTPDQQPDSDTVLSYPSFEGERDVTHGCSSDELSQGIEAKTCGMSGVEDDTGVETCASAVAGLGHCQGEMAGQGFKQRSDAIGRPPVGV